jgi:hypothetical protein
LASRCGFIREIFFPRNAARPPKCNRKHSRHWLHVSELRVANVVVNVVRHVVNVVRVRRESDPREESVNREENELHVRRGSGHPGHRESDPREESVNREENELHVRRGSDHPGHKGESGPKAARGPHVHHARRGSVRHAQRGLNALLSRLQRFQRLQRRRLSLRFRYQQSRRPRQRRLRRHPHQRPAMARVLLRASRGDLKPCYWHRHDINTASSIAVV